MHGRVLETCDPSCMMLQLNLYLSLRPTTRGESWDMYQHQSSSLRQGAVRSQRTRVNARALLGGEAGSDAEGSLALEPS
jgi:hypothetical protein